MNFLRGKFGGYFSKSEGPAANPPVPAMPEMVNTGINNSSDLFEVLDDMP